MPSNSCDFTSSKTWGSTTQPQGILELWKQVQKEWDEIEPAVCQRLIEHMPKRVEVVLRAKGGYTKYYT
jgi:hypothetical protein